MMKASKGILGLFLALSILISGVCVGDDSADILDFLPAFANRATFGNAVANPFFIVPGVSTPITISVYIPDANLVADSVQLKEGTAIIGNLTDTGNKVFSITNNFQRDNSGAIKLSIAATFGTVTKTIAQFEIKVLSLPTIQDASQYNQNIDNVFDTLMASQENFKALKDPSTSTGQFPNHLSTAKDRLLAVYAQMEAIYRAETHSPSNYPRAAASYLGLGDYLQSAQDIIDDREAFKNDPYYATNPRYAGMRALADELGLNINNRNDRELAAHLYLTNGFDSKFVKQFIPVAQTTITKKLGEQFTDLAGGAIGNLFGGIRGVLIGNVINAGTHKIIDIFISNTGEKGFAVYEVQNGEAVQLPAGSHDVLYSFGGVLYRAIARNIPVNPNLTTTVNIAPGEVKLCKYSYQGLGTLGGIFSIAHGINASGQVVGYSYTDQSSVPFHAFLKSPGLPMQDLGTLGGEISRAYGINDHGQVVGEAQTADGHIHAFLKNPGEPMQDLDIPGGQFSSAHGINGNGQVVGVAINAESGNYRAFLKNPGQPMQDLGALGGDESYASGINNSGQVVGYSYAGPGISPHAFLKNPGQPMQDLGVLGEDVLSVACGINASGQVIGYSYVPYASGHAFLKNPGQPMQDLGSLVENGTSLAYAINASGQVVGYTEPGPRNRNAFLKNPGEPMQDLNSLTINLPDGVYLSDPIAINDAGFIAGGNTNNQAYLLTPIP
jgi:probable HAF family extracellular repeat protein